MQTIDIINSWKRLCRLNLKAKQMRVLASSFFICLVLNLLGQASKYVNYINPQSARKHLEYLASDELEGREAGEKGQKLAGAYLMQNFMGYGLPPLKGEYFQKFNLRVSSREKIKLVINGDSLSYFNDFIHNSDFDDSSFSDAQAVFVGYGIESEKFNELEGVNVNNKVVFMFEDEPKSKKGKYLANNLDSHSEWGNRNKKVNNLIKKGAKAIIIVKPKLDFFKNANAHFFKSSRMKLATDTFAAKLPILFISEKKADSLFRAGGLETGYSKTKKKISKKGKSLSAELTLKIGLNSEMINNKITSENVLGYVEGGDKKDEFVIVTAHYDHIGQHDGEVFNGADDDGSGTTALLMMAEAFAQAKAAGHGPRRSILFMPVSAEEKGLLGSRYYSENPIVPLKNTIANLNIDMIGRVDERHHDDEGNPNPNYVYIIGSDFLSTDLHKINETQNKLNTSLELDYKYNTISDPNRYYFRSDHYNFAKHNIPCIFYFNGTHKDYHQHTDTVDKIDFMKLSKITELIYYTTWDLANREDRIVLDKE